MPDTEVIRVRRSFRVPNWDMIQHPLDREALDTLKRIPLLDKLIAFLIEQHWERLLYIQNISSSVRVTPRQSPRVWYIFGEANRIFDIKEPCELYITQNPILNSHTFGHKKPYIMLNNAIVEAMTDDELLGVIGHEIGHILSGHCLYTTMVYLMRPFIEFGLSNIPGGPLRHYDVATGAVPLESSQRAHRRSLWTAGIPGLAHYGKSHDEARWRQDIGSAGSHGVHCPGTGIQRAG